MALPRQVARIVEAKRLVIKSEDIFTLAAAIPQDYEVIAPVKKNFALNFDRITSPDQIALGYVSEERPGATTLRHDPGSMSLDRARAMTSPKWFTHRPGELMYTARRQRDGSITYEEPPREIVKQAFFGITACDVNGMYVLDRTFNRQCRDPQYDQRRAHTIIIGLNCLHPGNNCFCASYGYGPELTVDYDLRLSNLDDHYLVEVGSTAGAQILAEVPAERAGERHLNYLNSRLEQAKHAMPRAFKSWRVRSVLSGGYEHPCWLEISKRCLSCGNCVNVCPTCYCYWVTEQSSVDLTEHQRLRHWDTCQHLEFAKIHGANFRPKRVDRLRHWCNHKINWTVDQYGCFGCVGCGRCITYCPTGIDITEPVWDIGGEEIGLFH